MPTLTERVLQRVKLRCEGRSTYYGSSCFNRGLKVTQREVEVEFYRLLRFRLVDVRLSGFGTNELTVQKL